VGDITIRPSSRPDLIALYSNVAAAAFIAQNIEDMDLSEVIEPVLAPLLGNSVVAAIPGFAQVAAVGCTIVRGWDRECIPDVTGGLSCQLLQQRHETEHEITATRSYDTSCQYARRRIQERR